MKKMKRFWPNSRSVHANSTTWMPRKLSGRLSSIKVYHTERGDDYPKHSRIGIQLWVPLMVDKERLQGEGYAGF